MTMTDRAKAIIALVMEVSVDEVTDTDPAIAEVIDHLQAVAAETRADCVGGTAVVFA